MFSRPADLIGRLVDAGAEFPANTKPADLVASLSVSLGSDVGLFTTTTGWKEDRNGWAFLLPSGVVGNPAAPMILAPTDRCLAKGMAGTLEGWRTQVALPAGHSTQAGVAILAALAAPLLNFSDLSESFTLNIFGNSSSGKTTASRAAASIWGDPQRLASWNTTDRGLEEIAAANCDLPLILDDAEQSSKDSDKRMGKLHAASHIIASGSGKSYSKVVSGRDQLDHLKFRCIGLSSSPVSVEKSVLRTDGDRVRFLELAVAHGDEGGIWALSDPAQQDYAARSEALNQAVILNHGVAGAVWIGHLVARQDSLKNRVSKHAMKFLKGLEQTGSVEGRVAKKCAFLYAAGRLAIEAEVLPWKKVELLNIVRGAFGSMLHSGFGERFDVMRSVRSLAKVFADKRAFPHIALKDLGSIEPDDDVFGYYVADKMQVYLKLEAFKGALGGHLKEGHLTQEAFSEVVALMRNEKVLLPGHGKGPTRDIRMGAGKKKMVVVNILKLKALVKSASDDDGPSKALRT